MQEATDPGARGSDGFANQCHVLHRKNAPRKAIETIKFGDRNSDWICVVCSRGFKDEKAAREHCSSDLHKTKVQDQEVNCSLSNLTLPSDGQILYVTDFVEPIFRRHSASHNGSIKIRERIASELEGYMQKEFSDVTVGLHGSSASKFALQASDVNIHVSIPEHLKIPIAVVMKRVSAILQNLVEIYSDVVEDYYSYNKIPRINFKHIQSKLTGEIRVNVGNPLSLALILRLYHSIDVRVHQLGVLFRYWARVCRGDSQVNGHYPAHTFIVMAIHFLQQRHPPVVPVLHEMFPELEQKEQHANSDSVFITEEIYEQVASQLSAWKTGNSESLGQLWLGLFRYYSLEFQVEKYAVSILHSGLLPREDTQWGVCRLAVEDPMIPRSNLARAASNDKVFWYLWSSLKQSAIYFHQVGNDLGAAEVKSNESLLLEDESIVHVALQSSNKPGPCVTRHGQSLEEDPEFTEFSAAFKTLGIKDGKISESSTGESVLAAPVSTDVDSTQKTESPDGPCPPTSCVEGEQVHALVSSESTRELKPSSSKLKRRRGDRNDFKLDSLVYQKYPVVCLGCKKLYHNISNCPAEKLPSWKFPKSCPSHANLKSIKKIFGKHLRERVLNHDDELSRQQICDKLLSHVQKIYPDAKLELFGSSANGFSSYTSDLDICLSIPHVSPEMDKAEQTEIIETIAKRLRKYRDYQDITTITSARVPIIKFYLPDYRLECDISLENRLALRNTKLIYAYASLDERVRYLGYAVKHFAKVCDMGDASTGSLSSYAYILMTVHYLQRTNPPVIPCLQQIPSGHHEGPWINNWNCYFFQSDSNTLSQVWPHCKKNQETIGQLWLGFLRYYLTFDWAKEVVTIKQLEPLSKFDKWWFSKLMCIEDPFNLDHNLASAVGAKMRQYILERLYNALCYHSRDQIWKDIGYLFDPALLVGGDRAPKFIICNYCNYRGHKAATCPSKKQHEKARKYGGNGRVSAPAGNSLPASQRGHPSSAVSVGISTKPVAAQTPGRSPDMLHYVGPPIHQVPPGTNPSQSPLLGTPLLSTPQPPLVSALNSLLPQEGYPPASAMLQSGSNVPGSTQQPNYSASQVPNLGHQPYVTPGGSYLQRPSHGFQQPNYQAYAVSSPPRSSHSQAPILGQYPAPGAPAQNYQGYASSPPGSSHSQAPILGQRPAPGTIQAPARNYQGYASSPPGSSHSQAPILGQRLAPGTIQAPAQNYQGYASSPSGSSHSQTPILGQHQAPAVQASHGPRGYAVQGNSAPNLGQQPKYWNQHGYVAPSRSYPQAPMPAVGFFPPSVQHVQPINPATHQKQHQEATRSRSRKRK